jgi:hypothetical protein
VIRAGASIGLLAGLGLLTACAPQPTPPPTLPAAPVKAGPEIAIQATPVPLDAANPARTVLEGFSYAGGIAITSPQTSRLHGLSDMAMAADGTLQAVTDNGDRLSARLVLDEAGRLVGLTDGKLEPLKDPEGQPLQGKDAGDAEGIAILANGDRLVSFEHQHRIWLYPALADGGWGPPRRAPMPSTVFPDNEGMEAIAAYPVAGPDAYLVGGEEGELWLCRLSTTCQSIAPQSGPDFLWGLTAMTAFDGKAVATLHRSFDPIRGWRALLRYVADPLVPSARQVQIASLHIDGPATRDNFEGLVLSRSPSGATRVYLLSDDGALPGGRTLLMAFDWTPPAPPPPRPPKPVKKPARRP